MNQITISRTGNALTRCGVEARVQARNGEQQHSENLAVQQQVGDPRRPCKMHTTCVVAQAMWCQFTATTHGA